MMPRISVIGSTPRALSVALTLCNTEGNKVTLIEKGYNGDTPYIDLIKEGTYQDGLDTIKRNVTGCVMQGRLSFADKYDFSYPPDFTVLVVDSSPSCGMDRIYLEEMIQQARIIIEDSKSPPILVFLSTQALGYSSLFNDFIKEVKHVATIVYHPVAETMGFYGLIDNNIVLSGGRGSNATWQADAEIVGRAYARMFFDSTITMANRTLDADDLVKRKMPNRAEPELKPLDTDNFFGRRVVDQKPGFLSSAVEGELTKNIRPWLKDCHLQELISKLRAALSKSIEASLQKTDHYTRGSKVSQYWTNLLNKQREALKALNDYAGVDCLGSHEWKENSPAWGYVTCAKCGNVSTISELEG